MRNIPIKRMIIVSLLTCVALAVTFAWVKTGEQKLADVPQSMIPVTQDAFAGPYSLRSTTGENVTEKSWGDKYKLIYFGFTYCPAICPTELQKITLALKTIGERASIIQPLFITVDPERDTVPKMKEYVEMFHPSLIGLTGTPEEISHALKTFKIYAAKMQDESMSDYTMDHSSLIYFIAPDGRLLQIFKADDTADSMVTSISAWLDQELLR
jgi:protein SCO1/2